MNQKSVMPTGSSDPNEFPWADIFSFLGKHIFSISGCGLVGLVIGVIYAFAAPKQWEASSLVRIGQMQYSADGAPVLVEPLAQVVARVESRPFEDQVLRATGQDLRDRSSPLIKLVRKTLTASIVPDTNLIALTVRGFSADQAKLIIGIVQKTLIDSHAKIVNSFLSDNRDKLTKIQSEVQSMNERSKQLNAAAANAEATAIATTQEGAAARQMSKLPSGSNNVMLLGLLENNADAQRSLLALEDSFQQRINPARTFVTVPVSGVSTPDHPSYPEPVAFALGGLFGGLLIGVGVAGLLHQRRKRS